MDKVKEGIEEEFEEFDRVDSDMHNKD